MKPVLRVKEIEFFDSFQAWQEYIRCHYQNAVIAVDSSGVHRAHVAGLKVGAFGKLPDFGNVMSADIARRLSAVKRNGIRQRAPVTCPQEREARRARQSEAMRASWARRRAKGGQPPRKGFIRRLRAV